MRSQSQVFIKHVVNSRPKPYSRRSALSGGRFLSNRPRLYINVTIRILVTAMSTIVGLIVIAITTPSVMMMTMLLLLMMMMMMDDDGEDHDVIIFIHTTVADY